MHPLTAAALLDIWEHGLTLGPYERAMRLIAAAWPELSTDALARWSIGQCDAALLQLRDWIFGSRLSAVADCPKCGQALELTFDSCQIRVAAPDPLPQLDAVEVDEYRVQFRLPQPADVASATELAAIPSVRRRLLEACVVAADRSDMAVEVSELPPNVQEAIATRMSELDPGADIQLHLQCPACERAWLATFDVVGYLWQELHHWAMRTVREVHVLASAYGWREADILALSPARRGMYLEAVAQ